MQRVRELIGRVAPTDARVLITGEIGHREGAGRRGHPPPQRRAPAGPFIRVNCAAIPRDLVESELFGHEKGAFTGATERRRGPLRAGRRRARSSWTRSATWAPRRRPSSCACWRRARSSGWAAASPIPVDVRILAATNRDLRADVAAGRFREDLFFRLHVIPLHLPAAARARGRTSRCWWSTSSLRNRGRSALRPPRLTPPAMEALRALPLAGERARAGQHRGARWSSSTRAPRWERRRSAAVLAGSPGACARRARDAATATTTRAPSPSGSTTTSGAHPRGALEARRGNVAEAARRLQTDRANLYRRMRRLEIER